jgi:SAM-dependent methyltransferase
MNACHVCKGELRPRFPEAVDPQTKDTFLILGCVDCGSGETRPQPEELADYYNNYYGARHGFTANFRARQRMRLLEQHANPNDNSRWLLDVGCGEGTFLRAARKQGWNVCGTELASAVDPYADLEIFPGLDQVLRKFGTASFDAITMWHSLEHLRDPRSALRSAYELLKPSGTLLLAVPDAGGLQARVFRRQWLHLDVPRHLFHFGKRSLLRLLEDSGFRVERLWHREFEYDLLGISQSALNAVFREPNVFFRMLTGHSHPAGAASQAANFALGTAFSAIALPLVYFGSIARSGGTLVAAARKFNETM